MPRVRVTKAQRSAAASVLGHASSATRTPEERTAKARKAVNARWAKYRAKHKVPPTVEPEDEGNS